VNKNVKTFLHLRFYRFLLHFLNVYSCFVVLSNMMMMNDYVQFSFQHQTSTRQNNHSIKKKLIAVDSLYVARLIKRDIKQRVSGEACSSSAESMTFTHINFRCQSQINYAHHRRLILTFKRQTDGNSRQFSVQLRRRSINKQLQLLVA